MTCDEFRAVCKRFDNTTIAERAAGAVHYANCDDCRTWVLAGAAMHRAQMSHEELAAERHVMNQKADADWEDAECRETIREGLRRQRDS